MSTSLEYNSIEEYVAILASDEPSFSRHQALVEFGREFATTESKPSWLVHGPMKACFTNAQRGALTRPGLFYVEGYAVEFDLGIPMEHAWLSNAEGFVIDPTWNDPANCGYYGIAFTNSFLKEHSQFAQGAGLLHPPLMRRRYSTREAFSLGVAVQFASKR